MIGWRWLAIASLAACAGGTLPAHAFDEANAGVYRVLDQKGQATDGAFRFFQQAGQWVAEERQADGSWQPIACKVDCVIKPASGDQVARTFGKQLDRADPNCIQNTDFAVCSYILRDGSGSGFLFVALTGKEAIFIRLALLASM